MYLTNANVRDPFHIFDTYDWRSIIENGIFKEGKHPWHLLRFPKRTQAAVIVHVFFTLLVMALCTAFRLWQAQTATTATSALHRPFFSALALAPDPYIKRSEVSNILHIYKEDDSIVSIMSNCSIEV